MRGYRINKEALGGILEELKKRKRSPIGALKQGGIFEFFHTFSLLQGRVLFLQMGSVNYFLTLTTITTTINTILKQINKQQVL